VTGKYLTYNDDRGDIVDLSNGKIVFGEEHVRLELVDTAGRWMRFKARVYNIEVEDFHTYYVGQLGAWVHNTNCGGAGVRPENTSIRWTPDASTSLYSHGEARNLGRYEGLILVASEGLRNNSVAGLFERQTDFALTTADGKVVSFSLQHRNSRSCENNIRLGDGLQRMPDGSPSMTTIDGKAGPNGLAAAGTHSLGTSATTITTTLTNTSAASSTLTVAALPAGFAAGQAGVGYGQLWAAIIAINPSLSNGGLYTI
jgi:hypothetical protein